MKGQYYELYPNPTNGIVRLKQSIVDNAPVQAEIWNSTGARIFNEELHFGEGTVQLNIVNASQGMYMLKLIDSEGRRFILKFVINDK